MRWTERKAIPLSQFNASEPGQYWVKWIDADGFAVEGWLTKEDGARHPGRDPVAGDKGMEVVRDHYKSHDFSKKP